MINNRQGGRRRGRGGGGGRPQGNVNPGNRQDNRQRGNAAQLLEKYKGMARDAQMQGDRVQTEYFLQYADHYFRVLSESRVRYEEQRRQRDDYESDEDENEEAEAASSRDRSDDDEREEREPAPRRTQRGDGGERNGEYRGRRPRAPRRDPEDENEGGRDERIAVDSLPPAISAGGGDEGEAPAKPPRARRTRRPREEDGDTAAA